MMWFVLHSGLANGAVVVVLAALPIVVAIRLLLS